MTRFRRQLFVGWFLFLLASVAAISLHVRYHLAPPKNAQPVRYAYFGSAR